MDAEITSSIKPNPDISEVPAQDRPTAPSPFSLPPQRGPDTAGTGGRYLNPRLASHWPRRRRPVSVHMITPDEIKSWIIHDDEDVIVVNKPGDIVCHPSKAGPWSSLVSAVREHTGLAVSHLVFRLDRETSGVVVFAKNPSMAARLQKAMRLRRVGKAYLAIMTGEFTQPVTVDQPLGDDEASQVVVKSAVRPGGQTAVTHFTPLSSGGGFTLVRVTTETGRKHQIRAHAQWLGKCIVGDKIYGPDARCFLEFLDHGWTPALAGKLLLPRQALHCSEIDMRKAGIAGVFSAPLPPDLRGFCAARGIAMPDGI
jgi:23S rRNA pseudouridine1911/1915/1917 synthase